MVNLCVQLFLGIPLELVHRWWRVLIIYFAGVLAGSLATSILDPTTKLAGASGGVYAIITAHIAKIIMVNTVFFTILISICEFTFLELERNGISIYSIIYIFNCDIL